jgi:hypothetical protein
MSTERDDMDWPKPLRETAYYGLTGKIVRVIEPETEADPANLLISFLIAFGNAVGRKPFLRLGPTRHHVNEFAVLVGPTSRGRKGTGFDEIERLFKEAQGKSTRGDLWTDRIKGGLSTGEGLIAQVAEKQDDDGESIEVDKRLMLKESEFSRLMTVMCRPDNTMSPVIRGAWDSGILEVMTRKEPLRTSGAHVSFIGHVTTEELRKRLNDTDRVNGFANRFMFVMVERSKVLPFPKVPDLSGIAKDLLKAWTAAERIGQVHWGKSAKELWPKHYKRLTDGPPGQMLNAVTARSAQHVPRIAMIYALLDGPDENDMIFIRDVHLKAALEVWRYCEDSARYIFGDALGDDTADAILVALRQRADNGMTRTQMFKDLFSKNKPSGEIERAVRLLERLKLAESEKVQDKGRPAEVWYPVAA